MGGWQRDRTPKRPLLYYPLRTSLHGTTTKRRLCVCACTYALRRTRERVLIADLLGVGDLVRLTFQQIGHRPLGAVAVDRLQRPVTLAAQRPGHVAEVTTLRQHPDGLAQLSRKRYTHYITTTAAVAVGRESRNVFWKRFVCERGHGQARSQRRGWKVHGD